MNLESVAENLCNTFHKNRLNSDFGLMALVVNYQGLKSSLEMFGEIFFLVLTTLSGPVKQC